MSGVFNNFNDDTICAVATAMSDSGIGVIRVSGREAVSICDKIYRSAKMEQNLKSHSPNTIKYGYICDDEKIIDEVMISFMKAPHSFTREDVIEINTHGGILIMNQIIELLLKSGCRLADPGEFTKRAFLNGRIDLTKAEAIMDIISAQNNFALDSSRNQLRGSIYDKVKSLREQIIYEMAFIESALDDPENYDLTPINLGRVMNGQDPDITLQKNDELYVTSESDLQERGDMKIYGMVANPGTFPFAKNTTVEDLIIMAGGLREGASLARVDVARRKRDVNGLVQGDQVSEIFTLSLKDGFVDDGGNRFYLQPYDEVTIHQSPSYNIQTHVTLTGEANFPGSYTLTSRSERISDLVKKAGGTTNYAYLQGARLFRNMSDDERRQIVDILNYQVGYGNTAVDTANVYRMMEDYQVGIRLDRALANPGSDEDIILMEGDVLDIPVLRGTVRVMGAVMMPSVVSYSARMSGKDYIKAAGGYAPDARKSKAYVLHMNGNSEPLKAGTRIFAGDDIVIPEKRIKEGATDRTFQYVATSVTAITGMTTAVAYIYLMIQNSKK